MCFRQNTLWWCSFGVCDLLLPVLLDEMKLRNFASDFAWVRTYSNIVFLLQRFLNLGSEFFHMIENILDIKIASATMLSGIEDFSSWVEEECFAPPLSRLMIEWECPKFLISFEVIFWNLRKLLMFARTLKYFCSFFWVLIIFWIEFSSRISSVLRCAKRISMFVNFGNSVLSSYCIFW